MDRKRREVTNAARCGLARIRDTDGMGLVLLPAKHYEVLDAVSRWHIRLEVVERARAKPANERVPHDFGELTVTADELADSARREVLLGGFAADDFVQARPPVNDQ